MENNTIAKFILGFLTLIVGIALIGSVASSGNAVTDKIYVYNESLDIASDRDLSECGMGLNGTTEFSITNAPTGWKSTDCPIASFVMRNQTSVAAVVTTDYVFFDNNGSLFLKNTTKFVEPTCDGTGNTTFVDYYYCGDDYLNLGWGRTVIDLVSGFFAIALLLTSVGLFYSVGRDAGLIN